MSNKEFGTLVFIGRMQPFHNGYKAVIEKALEHAEEVVIVLGSAFQPRSVKNPFTVSERKEMIRVATRDYDQNRILITEVMDYPYDDNAWVSAVQKAVDKRKTPWQKPTGLIGHSKDHSSYYLKIFPDWRKHVEVDNVYGINATDIRKDLMENWVFKETEDKIPKEVNDYILDLIISEPICKGGYCEWFEDLSEEYKKIQSYKEIWSSAPFPPTFVTTDAVITQSGYILLIERGDFPFKGKWALPGGYLDMGQMVEGNMIKELREETCIKVPDKVLRGSIKGRAVFDHPDRDPRGRTITHGFYIDLGFPDEKLPKVKGGDDAKNAKWFPLSQIASDMMAFDHFSIIKFFIKF